MKTVTVLLSAYNGVPFLPDQLDSLLAQSRPIGHILVRDDGSTDGTLDLLATYAARHPAISFYRGENLGARTSFFSLMSRAADPDTEPTDYYALCDQDDRWLPNRMERAVRLLERESNIAGDEIPLLACSRPRLVDATFRPLRETRRFVLPVPSFGNALTENICIGCTATFNRALLLAAMANGAPADAVMHDWWLYLTAAGLGKVVFDPEPTVLYRQHGGNTIGMASTTAGHQIGRARRLFLARGKSLLCGQASEFLKRVGDRLGPEDRDLAERFVSSQSSIGARIALSMDRKLCRQRKSDNVLFRLMLILGHYRPH